jgi:hypothetical protein
MNVVRTGALVALTVAASFSIARMAEAQAPVFPTAATGNYALLNGDNLALYIDQFGDLGAPMNGAASQPKPGGQLNSLGQPFINSDGSVQTPVGSPSVPVTYAALYNPSATTGTIQQQVQEKTEYVTLGNRNAVEGWSLSVNNGASFVPYNSAGMNASPIVTSYNAGTGLLTATANTTYKVGATNLAISQETLFNDAGRKNLAEFVATFTNNGTSTISGLQYARAVDPNQGVAPGNTGNVNTTQTFGTMADLTQFAINSGDQEGLNRDLALGVHSSDPNSPGAEIYAVSGNQTEAGLLGSPQVNRQGNPNYIQLDPNGDGGANFVDTTNPAMDSHTNNYQQYLQNPALAPFLTPGNVSVTPEFSAYSPDTDLVLLSPMINNLAPGESESFTFFYTFGALNPVATPEPGTVSLLVSSALGASGLLFRTRQRRR